MVVLWCFLYRLMNSREDMRDSLSEKRIAKSKQCRGKIQKYSFPDGKEYFWKVLFIDPRSNRIENHSTKEQ